jgi:peptidoglycan lytic transglycosylase G
VIRKLLLTLIIVIVVAAVAGALLVNELRRRIQEPYKGYAAAEVFLEIPQGAASAEIRRRLLESGIVSDDFTLRAAMWWSGRSRSLQAGEYRFDQPLSPLAVVDKIANGDVYTQRLTFPEGLTIAEMAKVFESRGFGPASAFIKAAGDGGLIKDLDARARDLEGYLFPETYSLPRRADAARVVAMMVDRFRDSYDDTLRARAESQQLTTRQVVTLASLIEKETARAEERPIVAAVYRNRMKQGMGMQADPTVVYALMKAGKYDGNIRREDLSFDSPYNTYRYPGLPPGPIAAPGRASLEAALSPADVPYLYFVSRNDGSHVFAATLKEHNANVYQYQVLYFRAQRAARAAGAGGRGGAPANGSPQAPKRR